MQNNYLPEEIQGTYPGQALVQVEQSRAVEEVQASMIIAKRFPRDEIKAEARIIKECERKSLAEISMYSYPRGGSRIEGPSVRLAEVLARNWGNMVYGLTELSQNNGTSDVMAFAWDLETNTKAARQFTVQHIRQKRSGNEKLSDPRDIYEMVSNQGQRRVRACILEIIPADIVDKAMAQCNKTLKSAYTEPLADRITNMVRAFDKLGVPQVAIEQRLNHIVSVTTETEIAELKKIHQSLKDGMSKREDWFDLSAGQGETIRDRLSRSEQRRKAVQKGEELPEDLEQEKSKYEQAGDKLNPKFEDKEPTETPLENFLKRLKNQREGNGKTTGLMGFALDNKDEIIEHPEYQAPLLKKFERIYPNIKFPYPFTDEFIPEPTNEQLDEQPETPQSMGGVETAPEIEPESEQIPEIPEPNFETAETFKESLRPLIQLNRNAYFELMKELKLNSLNDVKEIERKEIYNAVKLVTMGEKNE